MHRLPLPRRVGLVIPLQGRLLRLEHPALCLRRRAAQLGPLLRLTPVKLLEHCRASTLRAAPCAATMGVVVPPLRRRRHPLVPFGRVQHRFVLLRRAEQRVRHAARGCIAWALSSRHRDRLGLRDERRALGEGALVGRALQLDRLAGPDTVGEQHRLASWLRKGRGRGREAALERPPQHHSPTGVRLGGGLAPTVEVQAELGVRRLSDRAAQRRRRNHGASLRNPEPFVTTIKPSKNRPRCRPF